MICVDWAAAVLPAGCLIWSMRRLHITIWVPVSLLTFFLGCQDIKYSE